MSMSIHEEIAGLLHIYKEAAQHGTELSNIGAAARARLVRINFDIPRDAFGEVDLPKPEPVAVEDRNPVPEPRNVVPVKTTETVSGEVADEELAEDESEIESTHEVEEQQEETHGA